ncbi:unnamed protein product [Clavelina lepadiformis]|uniref:WH1 domain-containing protein n=1 Tax=Clavelina lepadiformis TaxID=159417 RepID=A0ABP0FKP3_CLALP
MSEKAMCSNCKASVMIYDDAERKWKSAGRTPGLSNVNVYRHMVQNTFRVVGRKEQDGEVVINCAVISQLKYNRATPTFHQWRDGVRTVYGLNFSTHDEANMFAGAMEDALEMLRNGSGPPSGPSPAELEAKRREQEEKERQQKERERQEKERQERERKERERLENERIARERAAAACTKLLTYIYNLFMYLLGMRYANWLIANELDFVILADDS